MKSTSRLATIVAVFFLISVLVLSALITLRQMDSARGAGAGVAYTGMLGCCAAALAGLAGLAWAFSLPPDGNRRISMLAFGFATIILLADIFNLITQP